MSRGVVYALAAYVIWGLFPIYWKLLQDVPAPQLVGHRVVWSCVILCAVILLARDWGNFAALARAPRVVGVYVIAALLIASNWLVFIWAINAGYVIECSLGYFIVPLVNVLLGVMFLHERLRAWQWFSLGLAAAGLLYLTFVYGAVPWIGLAVGFSFGIYGLVKKTAPLGSLHGLTLETGILLLPALAYLLYCDARGGGAFLHGGVSRDLLLAGCGVVTTIPLLMFASAAKRVPLSHMGFMQYISPILQFLLGILVYKEPFGSTQLVGYGIVWAALMIFAIESIQRRWT
jgi:chloramphenicol-sensitive protein RarD